MGTINFAPKSYQTQLLAVIIGFDAKEVRLWCYRFGDGIWRDGEGRRRECARFSFSCILSTFVLLLVAAFAVRNGERGRSKR